jgi:outer membrane protein assembly factor BamA
MNTFFPGSITRCLPSLFLVMFSLSAQAQAQFGTTTKSKPPISYKLIAVKVTGSKRFTSEEVAAASGLPVGTIAFTYSYSSAGTKLEFQVTDADKFVPARFTDFVWFTEADLLHRVHDHVPLFKGELPTTGRLPDQVSDVLQAVLVENGIPGHVDYVRNNGKTDRLESIDYNVAGVSIRIHQADFPGAGASELPLLQAAAEKLSGREYSRDYMANFVEHALLPVYHEHGYLKAACATPQPTVVKAANSEPDDNRTKPTFVDVTFPVAPGIQYKLARWDWSGNQAIPNATLEPLVHLKAGQPLDTVHLENELRSIRELYGSRGYVLATIKGDAEFDEAAETVALHLVIVEGAVFHMGELEFRGIDNNYTARLRSIWKLRPGDVYDSTYLDEFLPQARKLLPASLDWEASPHVTVLAGSKTVDVDVQYTAKAPQ